MENVNWTIVIVVALICYTLYALCDLGRETKQIKQDNTKENDNE